MTANLIDLDAWRRSKETRTAVEAHSDSPVERLLPVLREEEEARRKPLAFVVDEATYRLMLGGREAPTGMTFTLFGRPVLVSPTPLGKGVVAFAYAPERLG